jgi:ribosomal protein S18 acetylase RimI-like enzyme
MYAIKPFNESHIHDVTDLLKSVFKYPYVPSRKTLTRLSLKNKGIVYIDNNEILGVLLYDYHPHELEKRNVLTVISLAVSPEAQRRKIGSILMIYFHVLHYGSNTYLHVKENNQKAINLYFKMGYKPILHIPEYYIDTFPFGDAIYMEKKYSNGEDLDEEKPK